MVKQNLVRMVPVSTRGPTNFECRGDLGPFFALLFGEVETL